MKIVAWVHFGVPHRRAGSETMLQTMMRALANQGHTVLVVCSAMPEAPATWHVDGVDYAALDARGAEALVRTLRPDVTVSHHDYAERTVRLSQEIGARSVLLFHSDFDLPARALALRPDLAVYNTEWVLESLSSRYPDVEQVRAIIVRPPVFPDEHQAPAMGDQVTLVNLSSDKGVYTWRGCASLCGDLPFMGVMGAHGMQIHRPVLRNMRIIGQTSDMPTDVWARTRVLLMPSAYESYGMAAVEALSSGIPVIAHPTPGLKEALGDAAVFVDRKDVRAWVTALRDLYPDGDARSDLSGRALARSAELASRSHDELKWWVETVESL